MERTMVDITEEAVRAGLARVRETIDAAAARSGRNANDVRLLAAVKYVAPSPGATRALVDAGIVDLAENRLEQLVARQAPDADDQPATARVRWHYIGRLQSRQVAQIAARTDMIHALCSASAARRLDQWWSTTDARGGNGSSGAQGPEVLVQVNVAGDEAKDGLAPDDVERFLHDLPGSVAVSGFMTMPAFARDPELSRPAFDALRELRDRLAPALSGRHELRWLSMGTSQDVAVAVEEGATHVRLGRILYGESE